MKDIKEENIIQWWICQNILQKHTMGLPPKHEIMERIEVPRTSNIPY